MIKHKNFVILFDSDTKSLVLYSFRNVSDFGVSPELIFEIVTNDEKIELTNITVKKSRQEVMAKRGLMDWYLKSKEAFTLDSVGFYRHKQTYEEVIKENDLILLHCALKDTATVFRVEKIRKGFSSFILGKYLIRGLNGISKNTNNLREEEVKASYKDQPTTRLFKLQKRGLIFDSKISDPKLGICTLF